MRRILAIGPLAALAVVLSAGHAAAIWNQSRFTIVGYGAGGDPPSLTSLNNAGLDAVVPFDNSWASACRAIVARMDSMSGGSFTLKDIVYEETDDARTLFKNADAATNRSAIINELLPGSGLNSAAVSGWSIWDEPPLYYDLPHAQLTPQQIFSSIHAITGIVRDSTTSAQSYNKLAFLNLLPEQAYFLFNPPCTAADTLDAYRCYLDEYLAPFNGDGLPAPLLCFDKYPFEVPAAEFRHYFDQLQITRDKAAQYSRSNYRIPFWSVIQASPRRDNTSSPYYPTPTFPQTRWQAFVSIAYGAKGIGYWTARPEQGPPDQPGYGSAFLKTDGTENHPLYDSLAALNTELHAVGGPLMYLDPTATYHQAAQGYSMPVGEGVLADPAKAFNIVSAVASTDSSGMVGYFKSPASSRDYLLIVNKDTVAVRTFTVNLGAIVDTIFHFNKSTGQYTAIATNAASFSSGTIASGGGEFFATGPLKTVRLQNHTFAGSSNFRAMDTLTTGTSVTVPSGVTLDLHATSATSSITLKDGFTASQGCTFSASIGAAPPAPLIRGDGTSVTGVARSRTDTGTPVTEQLTFGLDPGQPNPFSRQTVMRFGLPVAARARLEVFDLQGRLVRVLVSEPMTAGRHAIAWDRTNDAGLAVRPGTYEVRLRGAGLSQARKITVLD